MISKQLDQLDISIEENKKNIEILSTGFPQIDLELEGGFLKKELIVIGGKSGSGKSLLGATIFHNMAKQGHKCAYFSLEISSEMIASRLIGAKANISPTRILITQLEGEELEKKVAAKAEVAVYNEFMFFYDSLYVYKEIENEIKENDYDFIVLDFLQNVLSLGEEYERLSAIALNLQKLAKEKNCCILALSQLSNQMNRSKKTDTLEYKGSGSIATACDLGFFIEDSVGGMFTLRLRKNRRGPSGNAFNFLMKHPGGAVILN